MLELPLPSERRVLASTRRCLLRAASQDDFEIRVSVTDVRGLADLAAKSRDIMKGPGAAAMRVALRLWHRELVEHDGGQEKLAMDAVSHSEGKRSIPLSPPLLACAS